MRGPSEIEITSHRTREGCCSVRSTQERIQGFERKQCCAHSWDSGNACFRIYWNFSFPQTSDCATEIDSNEILSESECLTWRTAKNGRSRWLATLQETRAVLHKEVVGGVNWTPCIVGELKYSLLLLWRVGEVWFRVFCAFTQDNKYGNWELMTPRTLYTPPKKEKTLTYLSTKYPTLDGNLPCRSYWEQWWGKNKRGNAMEWSSQGETSLSIWVAWVVALLHSIYKIRSENTPRRKCRCRGWWQASFATSFKKFVHRQRTRFHNLSRNFLWKCSVLFRTLEQNACIMDIFMVSVFRRLKKKRTLSLRGGLLQMYSTLPGTLIGNCPRLWPTIKIIV